MRSRVPVLVVVLSALAVLPVSAEYRPVRANVLVIVRSTTAEEDQGFHDLLLNVIRVEVEDRELGIVVPEAPLPDGEPPLRSAANAGAEFALVGSYTVRGPEVAFDLSWYDAAAPARAATVSGRSAFDFRLDVALASAVVQLLDAQKDRISALPLKPDPNAHQEAVTPPAGVAAPELGRDVVRLKPFKPLMITAGAAPLIATFDATSFIENVYFEVKATAAWRFPLLGGAAGIGIDSGWQRYYVSNTTTGNDGWFQTIPIGAQIQYATRMPGPFDFFFHIDGGVVAWFLDPDIGSPSNGVVPYVQGGVGLIVNVLENLGVGIDVNYSLYFFNPYFTFLEPSLMLVLKF
jgi:hypothetical protein